MKADYCIGSITSRNFFDVHLTLNVVNCQRFEHVESEEEGEDLEYEKEEDI